MSAQFVAAALRIDLFRIDLAAVVSKWVGETSRNITLLRRAADLDVVLLFDEADALFGKRTDVKEANDPSPNTDTILLQAIESYRGIALLTTNRKVDIDPAFVRGSATSSTFPVPTEVERLRLCTACQPARWGGAGHPSRTPTFTLASGRRDHRERMIKLAG